MSLVAEDNNLAAENSCPQAETLLVKITEDPSAKILSIFTWERWNKIKRFKYRRLLLYDSIIADNADKALLNSRQNTKSYFKLIKFSFHFLAFFRLRHSSYVSEFIREEISEVSEIKSVMHTQTDTDAAMRITKSSRLSPGRKERALSWI